jgi:hypothetical protein
MSLDKRMLKNQTRKASQAAYQTPLGRVYHGLCEDVLKTKELQKVKGRVQLLFTSPPFVLTKKKKYGNADPGKYVSWLAGYARLFKAFLTENGSIAIELGNAWDEGRPTMSTLPLKALLEFQERAELYLCQEFICFNPARLPTPLEWVARKRVRVKDAFTRVWWLSATPHPKAENTRVLNEYSISMKRLLERGTYNAGLRPSEHRIGKKSFLKNNGGAIPPNVLVPPFNEILNEFTRELIGVLPISNTQNRDPYQEHCRTHKLEMHPARMPEKLVEFFVEFLSEPGDLVLDPFAGSNTTGAVAEKLGRHWISIEADASYITASRARFADMQFPMDLSSQTASS